MVRTKGAKDKKQRKVRRDRKLKYMKRKGKLVPYRSKRKKGDPIKVWFWERVQMSKTGYMNWSPIVRSRIKPVITKMQKGIHLINPIKISSVSAIQDFITEMYLKGILHEGEYLMMGFSHGKNKYHVKPVKLCKLFIMASEEKIYVSVSNTWRLSRYWFWKK
jgi:hypothetical protein